MSSIRNNLDAAVFQVIRQDGTTPAAGAIYQGPAPGGCISTLALLQFHFNADANVANRVIRIQVGTGAWNPYLAASQHNITANVQRYFIAHINNSFTAAIGPPYEPLCLPNSPVFRNGDTVDISVAGIQAGDAITAIRLVWHSWMVGA